MNLQQPLLSLQEQTTTLLQLNQPPQLIPPSSTDDSYHVANILPSHATTKYQAASGFTTSTINFTCDVGPMNLMQQSVKFMLSYDMLFTLANANETDIDSTNWYKLCIQNTGLCLSRYGILNAISDISCSFNSSTPFTSTNISEICGLLLDYYKPSKTEFNATSPSFPSLDYYTAMDGATPVAALGNNGQLYYELFDQTDELNIFGGSGGGKYASRNVKCCLRPNDGVFPTTDTKKSCVIGFLFEVSLPLFTFTNGRIFDTSNLLGIRTINLTMNMKAGDLSTHVFQAKNVSNLASISVSTANMPVSNAIMSFFTTTPQRWSMSSYLDSEQKVKAYSVKYLANRFFQSGAVTVNPNSLSNMISLSSFTLASVPERIYIGVKRIKNQNSLSNLSITQQYANIQTLSVRLSNMGQTITLANPLSIAHKSYLNGLVETDSFVNEACGYVVCLTSADFGFNSSAISGQSDSSLNCEVQATFGNLSSDTGAQFQLFVCTSTSATLSYANEIFQVQEAIAVPNSAITPEFLNNKLREITNTNGGLVSGGFSLAALASTVGPYLYRFGKSAFKNRKQIFDLVKTMVNETRAPKEEETVTVESKGSGYSNISGGASSYGVVSRNSY